MDHTARIVFEVYHVAQKDVGCFSIDIYWDKQEIGSVSTLLADAVEDCKSCNKHPSQLVIFYLEPYFKKNKSLLSEIRLPEDIEYLVKTHVSYKLFSKTFNKMMDSIDLILYENKQPKIEVFAKPNLREVLKAKRDKFLEQGSGNNFELASTDSGLDSDETEKNKNDFCLELAFIEEEDRKKIPKTFTLKDGSEVYVIVRYLDYTLKEQLEDFVHSLKFPVYQYYFGIPHGLDQKHNQQGFVLSLKKYELFNDLDKIPKTYTLKCGIEIPVYVQGVMETMVLAQNKLDVQEVFDKLDFMMQGIEVKLFSTLFEWQKNRYAYTLTVDLTEDEFICLKHNREYIDKILSKLLSDECTTMKIQYELSKEKIVVFPVFTK